MVTLTSFSFVRFPIGEVTCHALGVMGFFVLFVISRGTLNRANPTLPMGSTTFKVFVKRSFNKRMTMTALVLSEIFQAMIRVRLYLKVLWINAPSVTAFMMDFHSLWNGTNKIRIGKLVRKVRIWHPETAIPFWVQSLGPIPASGFRVYCVTLVEAFNRWLCFSRHNGNPTRPAKVKSAHDERQSWNELVKGVSCFCSHFKATAILTPMSV